MQLDCFVVLLLLSIFMHLISQVPISRKIIHIDMDAFYTSVEQLDFPELKGQAIAVGNPNKGGVVAAASYEARAFGVYSAMPSLIARKKCPHLIFQKPRFNRYRTISQRIHTIFTTYTDKVEPLSLDEAYLDVTFNKKGLQSAIKIAMLIRREIKEKLLLTASAGVSFNKFLAKIASDINKPDGLAVILPDEAINFMKTLEVGKFHGIGKVTAEKMNKMGIFTGSDLMKYSRKDLILHFGKAGKLYHDIITANDKREVRSDRIRKSIGAEQTYSEGLATKKMWIRYLDEVLETLMPRIHKSGRKGKTITLKVKYQDFEQNSRSKTLNDFTDDKALIWATTLELLEQIEDKGRVIRLLGITLTHLDVQEVKKGNQLTLDF